MPVGLISKQAQFNGPKGPLHTPVYPTDGVPDLGNFAIFTEGQPYEGYGFMREQAPVAWCREINDGPGFWAVSRYEDVIKVGTDEHTYSSQRGGIQISSEGPEADDKTVTARLFRAALDNMICTDGILHMDLRREHMPFFHHGYIRDLRAKVRAEVSSLLDRIEDLDECDLVAHFSARLPLFTLAEMLGIPNADRDSLVRWMHYLEMAQALLTKARLGWAVSAEEFAMLNDFDATMEEMFDYGKSLLHDRRATPRGDLLTAIANACIDEELLPDEFLDGSWLLILFAGNDTTRNSISGTMRLLTEFPDQKKRIRDRPDLLRNAVLEAIRMVSPVIHMRRTATRDTQLRGQKIAAGEKVVMWYGAANRDSSIFPDPDVFHTSRPNAAAHLAFGRGPHVCLGKNVAIMQLEEAYRQILSRFPRMVAIGKPRIAPSNFVHAIQSLPVAIRG